MPNIRSGLEAAFKYYYPTHKKIEDLAIQPSNLMKAMKKEKDLKGRGQRIPVKYETGGGASPTVAGAQAAAAASSSGGSRYHSKFIEWSIDPYFLYSTAYVPGTEHLLSEGDAAAHIKSMKEASDSKIKSLGEDLCRILVGNTQSSRRVLLGTVSGSPSGAVVTLSRAKDAANFHVGMGIVSIDSGSNDISTGNPTYHTVAGVNIQAGTITVNSATGIASTDDLYGATMTEETVPPGISDYLPYTAPTSGDSFLGVDRSARVELLAGWRQAYTGTITETIMRLAADVRGRSQDMPSVVAVSPYNFHRLTLELGGQVERDPKDGAFGVPGIMLHTPNGVSKVIEDAFLTNSYGYLLDMDTWSMLYAGPALAHVIDDDQVGKWLRFYNADALECRFRSAFFPVCNAPGRNGVFQIL